MLHTTYVCIHTTYVCMNVYKYTTYETDVVPKL